MVYWSVIYKENGNRKAYGCYSKKAMVKEYLRQLDRPLTDNISELKILKDERDYTATLNRFLAR